MKKSFRNFLVLHGIWRKKWHLILSTHIFVVHLDILVQSQSVFVCERHDTFSEWKTNNVICMECLLKEQTFIDNYMTKVIRFVEQNDNTFKCKITWYEFNEWVFYFMQSFAISTESYLRHPDIGRVFKSCIVNPHKPIDANSHATNNKLISMINLIGTMKIVKIAVCKKKQKIEGKKWAKIWKKCRLNCLLI